MAWSPHLGQFGQFGQNWGANLVFFALVPPYLFEDLERHRERAATCNPFLGDDFYCSSTIIAYKYWHVVTYSDIFILSYNMIVNMPKLTDVVLWLQDAASIKMLGDAWRCLEMLGDASSLAWVVLNSCSATAVTALRRSLLPQNRAAFKQESTDQDKPCLLRVLIQHPSTLPMQILQAMQFHLGTFLHPFAPSPTHCLHSHPLQMALAFRKQSIENTLWRDLERRPTTDPQTASSPAA